MSESRRIAVGGFQHETNTFGATRATFEEFEKHDGWPGLTRGSALLQVFDGMNVPIAGYLAAAAHHELLPLLWCSAEPSAHVTEDAFERVMQMMCEDLAGYRDLDGVFLDLHGAMVVEHHDDGEGEILRRVREVVGPRVAVVASLDFHANITDLMMTQSDAFAVYRTYPHLDMETTGARAHVLLEHLLEGKPLAKAFRKLPFLLPLTAQCTDFEPNRSLFDRVHGLEVQPVRGVEFAEGFPPADIHDCGPSVIAYADAQDGADAAADELFDAVMTAERDFENPLLKPADAIARAMASADSPVVLADVQDNPGAGGSSDTVGLLGAMVEHGARRAVIAIVHDPHVATRAHAVGAGGRFETSLGAKLGSGEEPPFTAEFEVETLSDGRFTCTGEMYRGTRTNLGPMALLRVVDASSEVRVIVGSGRFQCLDQAVFTHIGVDPKEQQIVAVKSTVHFRADFDPIAALTLAVESPGVHYCRLTEIPYRNLRPGVRLGPLGPPSE